MQSEKGEYSLTIDEQRSDEACENNEIEDKENPSTEIAYLKEMGSQILGFVEKYFKALTLLSPIFFVTLERIWKLPQICAQIGKLSIYGLESIGVEFYSKLVEFEIIESIALFAVFLACNFGSYLILVQNTGLTKTKKGILTAVLLSLEIIPLLILANEGNSIGVFIQSFRRADAYDWIILVITILTYLMTMNVIAVLIKIERIGDSLSAKSKKSGSHQLNHITSKSDLDAKKTIIQDGVVTKNTTEKKNMEHENNKEKEFKMLIGLILVILILMTAIYMAMIYTSEGKKEEQRCQFDVIAEIASDTCQTKFHFENKENGEAFVLFPIIAENDNQYIVSRLYRSDDGEVHIDRNYHKIINKGERAVYRILDVYNENYEEFIANIM